MAKTCIITGSMVQTRLKQLGIETPVLNVSEIISHDKQMKRISKHMKEVLTILGLDLKDDSLKDTPDRVAKMFVEEIFWGLDYNNFPKCTTVKNTMKYNQILVEEKISVKSMCEHHLVPITGYATVGYLPGDHVIGLSKLNRIVEFFSRRPQVQERLTEQIFEALRVILGTNDIAVVVRAEHLCVQHRGVQDTNSLTTTSRLGGIFEDDASARAEFFSISKGA